MNFELSAPYHTFRDEVRDFCCNQLPPSIRRKQKLGQRLEREEIATWQRILNTKGWVAPQWPQRYGGAGWDAVRAYLFREECHRAWAPEVHSFNIQMVGPVIIAFGTEAQKERFLPAIRNLDIWFCQGFSEPGAGSDLASLKTRAVRQGNVYEVSGQKLWITGAHKADWMFALVRTDAGAAKQRGISFLLIDMKSPGVEVRPILTLDGDHYTNEVFLDRVKVPVENLIGEENRGWTYAKFLLGNERTGQARVGLAKARIEMAKGLAQTINQGGNPLANDNQVRNKLALLEIELKALEITTLRVAADAVRDEGRADPRSSVLKLKGSELQQATAEMLLELAGPQAMARQVDFLQARADHAMGDAWTATAALNYYFTRVTTIYGGSSEIQRNVVAKAVLGL